MCGRVRLINILAAISLLVFAVPQNISQAADITYDLATGTISVAGPLSDGDVEKFKSILDHGSATRVALNSSGGSVDVAFGLIDVIRQRDLQTVVPESGICFS